MCPVFVPPSSPLRAGPSVCPGERRKDASNKGPVDKPALVSPVSQNEVSARGGGQARRAAHVSLGHIPGKSLLTLCLSGQGRHSDRRAPPWHYRAGSSEAEQGLTGRTQQGPVAGTRDSPKVHSPVPVPAPTLTGFVNLGQPLCSGPQQACHAMMQTDKERTLSSESFRVSSPKILPRPRHGWGRPAVQVVAANTGAGRGG